MRGGSLVFVIISLCLSSCASDPPAATNSLNEHNLTHTPKPLSEIIESYEQLLKVPSIDPVPVLSAQGSGLRETEQPAKLAVGVVQAKAEPAPREPGFEDLLKLQKEIAARHPASDEEKLRLALLYASAGNLEESERIFSSLRAGTGRLAPYLELFLRRELGDHQEAAKLLARFEDEDRRAAGFGIAKAALCTQVRRFRDFTPAESDRVRPGGMILLYVEPRNFALQRSQDLHILHLKYEWKLTDDRSTEVPVPAWEQAKPEDREDRVTLNGPVTEFYQSFRLPLPTNLAPGRYRVQVAVTDAASGKSDRVSVPLLVTGVEGKP